MKAKIVLKYDSKLSSFDLILKREKKKYYKRKMRTSKS